MRDMQEGRSRRELTTVTSRRYLPAQKLKHRGSRMQHASASPTAERKARSRNASLWSVLSGLESAPRGNGVGANSMLRVSVCTVRQPGWCTHGLYLVRMHASATFMHQRAVDAGDGSPSRSGVEERRNRSKSRRGVARPMQAVRDSFAQGLTAFGLHLRSIPSRPQVRRLRLLFGL